MVRVRLAPSPTGTLHIGTARTAVFNWLFARQNKGTFLLRIEDTDRERSKPEFVNNILEGLNWLGLTWDENIVTQSHRVEIHTAAIEQLLADGKAYRCYVNETELNNMRSRQKAANQAPRYDNRHRNLTLAQQHVFIAEGRQPVIRFRIDDEAIIEWNDMVRGPMKWKGSDLGGDMVIARQASRDQIGDPLYNLVVVIDDALMGITHVIRGEDHIANTAKQVQVYKALGLACPEFAHTPLILNKENRKLSKRDGVTSINDFRNMGYSATSLSNYMTLLGWSPPSGMSERFSLQEAAEVFHFDRVNKAGAKFDWDKLNWLNSQVLHELSSMELLYQLQPQWAERGWTCNQNKLNEQLVWERDLCDLLKTSLTVLSDGVEHAMPFFEFSKIDDEAWAHVTSYPSQLALRKLLKQLEIVNWDGLDFSIAKEVIKTTCKDTGIKKGVLMKSLRAALLGKLQGPDLLATWSLLARVGKDRIRIRRCL
uniref:glutamate--tRNA ligase n=1 Tax=Paulinella longichromatophora TaxID=1708747 RepID=A0A2H4ZNE8_9EUKA|nr:glutamyl-tRNA synthetase [Paulinella longichromatophora]